MILTRLKFWHVWQPLIIFSVLESLIDVLQEQEPGDYILTHCPQHSQSCLYRATQSVSSDEAEKSEDVSAKYPLLPQWRAEDSQSSELYDLHKAHENSGVLDPTKPWFVPPSDGYYERGIPFLFPLKVCASKRTHAPDVTPL